MEGFGTMKTTKTLAFFLTVLGLTAGSGISALSAPADRDWVRYVNPLVGTLSDFELSAGNTYPAVALPWGMNFWTPQTGRDGDGWQYTYQAKKITGFKQTHQPSPWINDYGCFSLMPVTGKLRFREGERASWFSHKTETAGPHYYRVYLADHDTWVELAPTERAAQFRITFPEKKDAYVVLDAFPKGSSVRIIPGERKITGFSRFNSGGTPSNFKNFFVLEFDSDFEATYVWSDSTLFEQNLISGDHVGAAVRLRTAPERTVAIKVASSFISPEQAELNLKNEIGGDSFDQTEAKARGIWNRELGKIAIEGGTDNQLVTFYTALYRTLLFPRKFYEFDRGGRMVHYSPYSGETLPGPMFTDNGFWDTFRAAFPLNTILSPSLNGQIMQGLANTALESGWLPEWASPGHRDCMIGSNSASIIADSYLKGIRGYDINTLYEALVKNSNCEGPLRSVGRYGVDFYNSLGYVPYDVGVNENTARTLEYSYDDFCLMRLAKALDRPKEEIDRFAGRALNYTNLFNRSSNFMQGRNRDGSWQSPFVPEKWGDAFTEGCSWHYTWCVFHDILGLESLMGGKTAFAKKLDSLFTAPPRFDFSYYGFAIHEITEMAIAGMGQYAHGNQPVQHGAYLFDYCGEPWKTQSWVRQIMDRLYTPLPDGLCGDEDNGQTSAWYVFSALGFYPVCPGTGEYALGSPLFKKAVISLENGRKFVIEAPENSGENVYILGAELNGKSWTKNFIRHEDVMMGGNLVIQMGDKPNRMRGVRDEDFPFSYSRESR
jgi:predicted alpha-1,2-mannosidase